jgi:uncharacterized membrane protein
MFILILFFLLFPAVILFMTNKFSIMNKIGAVLIAYFFGLVIGNSGLIVSSDREANIDKIEVQAAFDGNYDITLLNDDEQYKLQVLKVQDMLSSVSVLLAIPLLLFSSNIKKWLKVAGKTMLSGLLVAIAVATAVISGYYIFVDQMNEGWQVAGLLTGVYTGGTPNMAAIQTALNVNSDLYITVHTYDMMASLAFIIMALTFFQRFGLMFLPKYKLNNGTTVEEQEKQIAELESYDDMLHKKNFFPLLKGFGLSVLILAAGFGMSMIFPKDYSTVAAILTITSLGIALSLIKKVNMIPKTFHLGMYLILIFSLVVASMGDLRTISDIAPDLLYYVVYVVFGITILNFIFSAIFRIDADTTIITMTSLIFSPPFVPVVAAKLKNKEIIISGLTIGIIGYAAGNYLGILIAYALK